MSVRPSMFGSTLRLGFPASGLVVVICYSYSRRMSYWMVLSATTSDRAESIFRSKIVAGSSGADVKPAGASSAMLVGIEGQSEPFAKVWFLRMRNGKVYFCYPPLLWRGRLMLCCGLGWLTKDCVACSLKLSLKPVCCYPLAHYSEI